VRAVSLLEVNRLVVGEVERPVPAAGQCLIKVLVCGICGTDRHIYKGEYPSGKPVILGHEFGGIIEEVAAGSKFKVGQVVSIDPNIVCGKCSDCLAGRTAFCPELTALGVNINGGLAEYVLTPDSQIYPVIDGLNPLHLAFIEPLACSIRGLDLAELKGGERVAVLGGGVIGLLVVQLAKLAGASEIVLVTRQKFRREVALKIGATRVIDPKVENVEQVLSGIDVTFECAGAPETIAQSQEITRRGGSIIILGLTAAATKLEINPFNIVVNELRIQGSFLNPLTQARAAELVGSGKLNLDILISKVIDLDGVAAVLDAPPAEGDIKYLVCP
jgi:L-iditol 2-dehydrogenase|tara:strand:+ start:14187 stop:15179 length:993 start_codon:yes stop_codon:yes gene_type:complete